MNYKDWRTSACYNPFCTPAFVFLFHEIQSLFLHVFGPITLLCSINNSISDIISEVL